ncbi:MAG: hypothetical protein U0638_16725 [Phycisphaerales bacterium]
MNTPTTAVPLAHTQSPGNPRLFRTTLGIATAAVLGLAAVTAPPAVVQWNASHALPPFTLQKLGIDQFQPISVVFLLIAGIIGSLIAGRGRWHFVGPATMLAFPILMAIEIVRDSSTHNLFPLELISYAVLTIPGLTAAAVTDFVMGRLSISTRRV